MGGWAPRPGAAAQQRQTGVLWMRKQAAAARRRLRRPQRSPRVGDVKRSAQHAAGQRQQPRSGAAEQRQVHLAARSQTAVAASAAAAWQAAGIANRENGRSTSRCGSGGGRGGAVERQLATARLLQLLLADADAAHRGERTSPTRLVPPCACSRPPSGSLQDPPPLAIRAAMRAGWSNESAAVNSKPQNAQTRTRSPAPI